MLIPSFSPAYKSATGFPTPCHGRRHLPSRPGWTRSISIPIPGRKTFPNAKAGGRAIDAAGSDRSIGVRSQLYGTLSRILRHRVQTETCIRDIRPALANVNANGGKPGGIRPGSFDAAHGRESRVIDGKVVPCSGWITEVNISPTDDNPQVSVERALALKAKSTARFYCFFLNKGMTQIDLFAATSGGGDKGLGLVLDSFMAYAAGRGAAYPQDDTGYTSPALMVTGRIAARLRENLDATLTAASTRVLRVASLSDKHNHYQFLGDGTAAHPNLYNRDVLSILPFQVNQKRFVIPYYVMTRDYTTDLPPEQYTMRLDGIHGTTAQATAYDPIDDRAVPVSVQARGDNSITLEITAADYPYLLTIQE